MLTEFFKHLLSLDKTGAVMPDAGTVHMRPEGMALDSLEQYALNRYRERFTMRTPSIDEFARYFNDRSESIGEPGAVNVFVDTDAMRSSATFNVYSPDMEPDHCDDTAHCELKPLPVWAFLQGIGELSDGYRVFSQRNFIDMLRDWNDYIESPAELVQKFQRVTIDQVKNRTASREDFSESDDSLESISLKAEGGDIPSSITFNVVPYDGFGERQVTIGIAASFDRSEAIALRVRVDRYEPLKLEVAEEFAEALAVKLNVKPYLGTFSKA